MRGNRLIGCAAALIAGAIGAQAAWGFKYEVSPNGVSWGSTIAVNPGGTVHFRVSVYFDIGTQVTTASGVGNAVMFNRFTGRQMVTNRLAGDAITDMVRLVPTGGVALLSVSVSGSDFILGTNTATSFASYVTNDVSSFVEHPQTVTPILKGKLTLGPDTTPRTMTVQNSSFGSGGMRFYSELQPQLAESGNPVDHPNHTDFTATIQIPGTGCPSPTVQSVSGGGAVAPSQTAVFSVSATNGEFYEWLKNGVTIVEDGRHKGTGSSTLTITDPAQADAGSYRARVYNACGVPKLSDAVALTIICGGDFNRDAFVDDADFVAFVQAYEQLTCPAAPAECAADLNSDGFVDDADFVVFVAQYDQMLCPL